jgi:FixJ family two-component response regulator
MIQDGEVVYLVDDDERIREGLTDPLEAEGRKVVAPPSAVAFPDYIRTDEAACLIGSLEICVPRRNSSILRRPSAFANRKLWRIQLAERAIFDLSTRC